MGGEGKPRSTGREEGEERTEESGGEGVLGNKKKGKGKKNR